RRPAPQAIEDVLRRVDEAHALLRQQAVAVAPPSPPAPAQASLLPVAESPPARAGGESRRREAPPPTRPAVPPPSAPAAPPAVAPPMNGEGAAGVAEDPAVQAAIAEFQGEVVAVRPRLPEGESQ